jgi:vitamin K-dependent gamma-carboxylase
MRSPTVLLDTLGKRAFAPVDIASLVFFRIAFGVLMIWEVFRHSRQWITACWIEPPLLFKYCGFSWVHPWPGNGLYIHWFVLGVVAFFLAAGFLYRINAVLFFLSYTYFFLLDEARYVNHTYLVCLFSFLLIFIPANRAFSVDAWLRPKTPSETTPAWTLWLLRAQMGVVYFYGGLAKIAPDWLHGEPMRTRMSHNTGFPIIGRFFREEWAVYAVTYGGLLLDLSIVPLLLWRRTRLAAFCLAVAFHLINARAFTIGVFPWLAIAATTLFLSPSWPRRVIGFFRRDPVTSRPSDYEPPSVRQQRFVLAFVMTYLLIQLLIPLRHFLYGTATEWTSIDHRFSWRMMLVNRRARAYFYLTDPNSGRTRQVVPQQFLNARQSAMMAYQPDMPVQFAHHLASVIPRQGPKPLRVEARIFVSINGRKPELFIDPNVDLAAEPRPVGRPRWLLAIHEPLPSRGIDFSKESFAPPSDDN